MAVIMVSAAWALTGNVRIAIVSGMVPFVLGMTNILTGFAYSITAGVFILAVAVQIIGFDTITEVKAEAEKFLQDAAVVRSNKRVPTPALVPLPVEATPLK